ncbi:hypothetical protein [Terrimonas pollutisoli]|uniref:hypothetical protein n=1 Tax=Terrimonas pollutisoli TaxID=3034147 RepID=UPI0023EAC815|nr:hypothetical protein [Terrimonas sp. H1YJ31]
MIEPAFKIKVYNRFLQTVLDKVSMLQQELLDLKESSSNETKSTAGDKHETALAMLQLDQEKTSRQLQDALVQKALFEQIDPAISTQGITNGSLVKTNKGYLFLSVAIGKIIIDGKTVIALSPGSPMGKALMGLRRNDTASINGNLYQIEDIC